MQPLCRTACCDACRQKAGCAGCVQTDGKPFGGTCIAAETIKTCGFDAFLHLKATLIDEFNSLGIEALQTTDLHLLNGFYLNLEYRLANGQSVKLLDDRNIYLGDQIKIPNSDKCYGIAADDQFLLVCRYGCGGTDPEIILYKRRFLQK